MSREIRSRFFDHTADLGIEITAPDPASLFLEAARAVLAWLGDPVPQDDRPPPEETAFRGRDLGDLLVDWLGEVLYQAQSLGRIPAPDAVLTFDGPALVARVAWIPINRRAHRIDREIKAVTYHRLEVTGSPGTGYRATLILDV